MMRRKKESGNALPPIEWKRVSRSTLPIELDPIIANRSPVSAAQARTAHARREDAILLHFVEQCFVTDLQACCGHLAVPLGANQSTLNDPGLGFFFEFLQDSFQGSVCAGVISMFVQIGNEA